VGALLDAEADVPGIAGGRIGPIFRTIGLTTKTTGAIDPACRDLAVTAGQRHAGKEGVTMPAQGKPDQRPFAETELQTVETQARNLGLAAKIAR